MLLHGVAVWGSGRHLMSNQIVTDIEEEGRWILAETQYISEEQNVFIEDLEMY